MSARAIARIFRGLAATDPLLSGGGYARLRILAGGGLEVSELAARISGNGWGTATLALLCALADRNGVCIEITADADPVLWATDEMVRPNIFQTALFAWYRRFGFNAVGDEAADTAQRMVRRPKFGQPAAPEDARA